MMYSGFGVAHRLLVQELHARHALAFLGRLDPIRNTHQARSEIKWPKQDKAETHPARGQDIEVERLAVKK